MALLWVLMMLVWLAAWVFGLWWMWPHFERMALTAELVMSFFWLMIGAVAWIFAFNLGRERYWRR